MIDYAAMAEELATSASGHLSVPEVTKMRAEYAVLAAGVAACSPAPAAQEQVRSGDTFTCTPIPVWDGDGPIWCAEGPKIRLAGIAARELDGSCRPAHPCPAAEPALLAIIWRA